MFLPHLKLNNLKKPNLMALLTYRSQHGDLKHFDLFQSDLNCLSKIVSYESFKCKVFKAKVLNRLKSRECKMIRAQQLETAKTKQGKLVDAHN